jgi:CheY-like chemotaxis protein
MWDVLVVDDDGELATTWAIYLAEILELRTRAVTTPAEAEAIVKRDGVKVAVIDQEMPGIDGVTLGARLRDADRRIRRIMLSSKATTVEAASAYDIGFDRFIHKNAGLEKLPDAVMRSLIEQQRLLAQEARSGAVVVYEERRGILRRDVVSTVYLLSVDGVDNDYVSADEWRSYRQLHSGETVTEEFEFEWQRSESLEFSSDVQTASDTGIKVSKFPTVSLAVKREVAKREHLAVGVELRQKVRRVRTLTLPEEPTNPGDTHVSARVHQYAPIYRCVSVTLMRDCAACGDQQMIKAQVFFPAGRVATRHIDYFNDNSPPRTVPTGETDVI